MNSLDKMQNLDEKTVHQMYVGILKLAMQQKLSYEVIEFNLFLSL